MSKLLGTISTSEVVFALDQRANDGPNATKLHFDMALREDPYVLLFINEAASLLVSQIGPQPNLAMSILFGFVLGLDVAVDAMLNKQAAADIEAMLNKPSTADAPAAPAIEVPHLPQEGL